MIIHPERSHWHLEVETDWSAQLKCPVLAALGSRRSRRHAFSAVLDRGMAQATGLKLPNRIFSFAA